VLESLFKKLVHRFDPERRVQLLRSSEDSGLGEYLEAIEALASTDMDPDGRIYIKIHDKQNPTKGVWLEEFAHALQFLQYGNVPLSSDDRERRERELEVAQCLFQRAERQHLTQEDISHLERAIRYYGEA
jgi:hypothetical protein